MIIEKEGNILESGTDIICHQVNCMGVMGAGLAKQIRARHPRVFSEYSNVCIKAQRPEDLLGTVQFVHAEEKPIIANLFSQCRFGSNRRFTDYDALRSCLQAVKNRLKDFPAPCRVALPYGIGCGLAGGNWNIVRPMIEEVFASEDCVCEIWRFELAGRR